MLLLSLWEGPCEDMKSVSQITSYTYYVLTIPLRAILKQVLFLLQLCIVTLSLFETLVSLNCEDVMLWLVFRHLIPMQHLLTSQKNTIRQPGNFIAVINK